MPVDRQDADRLATGADSQEPVATVGVAEAARALGKSTDAVRAALHRRTLEGWRDNRGEWRIPLATLPTLSVDRTPTGGDRAEPVARQDADRLEELERLSNDRLAAIVGLREQVARLQGEMAGIRATATAEVNAAVRTAEETIAAHGELVAELRRSLEHERGRGDRLEAELRRPWWRRLIG